MFDSVQGPQASPKLTVGDLFSGAGLLGYAFHIEGFELSHAFERDPVAAATHRRNLPGSVTVGDLLHTAPVGSYDVLIAGPPCQGFSSIGSRRSGDPRNGLCELIPTWATKTGARLVLVENVPSFLESMEWASMVRKFRRRGYSVRAWTLNARDFGVAQNRLRSFTIASLEDVPDLGALEKLPRATVRQAFRGLPKYPAWSIQHYAREQSAQSFERIRLVPPGGDVRHLADKHPHLVPPSWFRTNGKIVDIWGRLDWNGISNTLRTGFLNPSRGRFLHPTADRPISFREAARLQGLPDTFLFEGTPEQLARQIGNGVPIGLGRAVAQAISQSMSHALLARS
jgi:DNA (cytosine-5)-methyltransferase 1